MMVEGIFFTFVHVTFHEVEPLIRDMRVRRKGEKGVRNLTDLH